MRSTPAPRERETSYIFSLAILLARITPIQIPQYYNMLITTYSNSYSGFATVDHDHHRRRRAPLSKFCSKAQISKLEPMIHDKAQQLCNKLLAQTNMRQPFDLTSAYSCFTSDVISEYCFGESFGFLEQESFEPNFRRAIYAILNTHHLFKFFTWLKVLTRVES
jgi:cytochrome P450